MLSLYFPEWLLLIEIIRFFFIGLEEIFPYMKSILLSLILSLPLSMATAQHCVIENWDLEKRVQASTAVLEGTIIAKEGVWLEGQRRIYTLYTLEVYKQFKFTGVSPDRIQFISDGGQIGTEKHEVHPSIHFSEGDWGVFFLSEHALRLTHPQASATYYPAASMQSFIQYDLSERHAFDGSQKYEGINGVLYPEIERYTGAFQRIRTAPFDGAPGLKPLAAPIITSWSHDTITGGTGSILTINGANFGSTRGSNGKVEFRDADFGDGRFYVIPFDDNYVSWSNSQIQVKVPSRAGTGTIRITNDNNESSTTTQAIHIPYAHLNVQYTTGGKFYETDHIDVNNKGGYTWRMNHKFRRNDNRVNAMLRSLETWRCNTLVNWEVGADTDSDSIGRDNINVIRITKFPDNKLGVCWSFWSGCWNGSDFDWYTTEMDIEFDSTKNWYYGTGTPGGSQYDFETVATHELGHGHQLAHVIDSKKVMHYSLGTGQRKVIFTPSDQDAGDALMAKSTKANVCGPGAMKAIQRSNCNITKPKADFTLSKTIGCPGDMIFLTDATEGVVNTYFWQLDSSASSLTFSTKGPHIASWNREGEKTITLIVTNSFGSDTVSKTLNILPAAPDTPAFILASDTLCIGLNRFDIDSVPRASSYLWNLVSGGLIIGGNTGTAVNASLGTAGGPYTISVKAVNTCGESASRTKEFYVVPKAKASFTESVDGRTVVFTNTSAEANRFKWYFGDGDSSENANPEHIYRHAWTYEVRLFAFNQCSVDSAKRTLTTVNPASLQPLSGFSGLDIYPNPVHNELTIKGLTSGLIVKLKDMNGRILLEQEADAEQMVLPMHQWAKGIYLLSVHSTENGGSLAWKLLKY